MPTPSGRRLLTNVASYTALQGFQYLAPFLALPVVTRALGAENYGWLSVTIVVCGYLNLWMDFGFAFSATREVAALADQPQKRRQVFWSIQACKLILGVAGSCMIVIAAALCADRRLAVALVIGATGTAMGHLLLPTWYFEGQQQLKRLAAVLVAARVLQLLVVLSFVRSPDDFFIALVAEVSVNVLAGALLLPHWSKSTLPVIAPPPSAIRNRLGANVRLFAANVAITLYTSANTLVLAIFATPAAVGMYALADRALTAAKMSLRPLSASLYPHLSQLAASDLPGYRRQWPRTLAVFGAFGLVTSVATFVLARPVIELLGGPEFAESARLLRWLAPVPLLVALSNFFGIQTLLPLAQDRTFAIVLTVTSVSGLLMATVLAGHYAAMGVVISAIVSETIATVLMGIAAYRVIAGRPR